MHYETKDFDLQKCDYTGEVHTKVTKALNATNIFSYRLYCMHSGGSLAVRMLD